MKGMTTAFPRWARSPIEMRRTRKAVHSSLASQVRRGREHIARLELRLRAGPLTPSEENEILEELRKTIRRLKTLEGLRSEFDPVKSIGPPDEDAPEPSTPVKRERPVIVASHRKLFSILAVALLIGSSAVWILNQHGAGRETGFDLGPRWKDESASHFTFAASADFGPPSDNDSTALAFRARTAGMSFLLALGDLGNTTNEAGWCRTMKQYVPEVVIVPGSRDVSDDGDVGIAEYVKSCPYPLASRVVPGVGTPGYGYEYYFDYPAAKPLARFIMVSPGLGGDLNYNYSEESPHTEWLEAAVDDARDHGIPWVIAGAHAQCITVGVRQYCAMGQLLFDELVEANIDLILVGGDHAYERSKQLEESGGCESVSATGPVDPSCIVDDGLRGPYSKGAGTVVIVQGVGGEGLSNVSVDGSDPQIGYFAEAMGRNANTEGGLPGFGSVFYTVTRDSISAKTDFCPPGLAAKSGQCPSNSSVFKDRFSIADTDPTASPSELTPSDADGAAAPGPTMLPGTLNLGILARLRSRSTSLWWIVGR